MASLSAPIGIAAASYEGSLFSWKGETDSPDLNMTSGFHCCAGSIRSLSTSISGRYLACGASDERIHIFNMIENKTIGQLSAHTGAVTCLDFFEDSYLLSGSDDNSICIWRTHDWLCVHILGGHKGSINSVAIHPSGKLAVSVAQDNTLKLWNLVQGRIGFTRRLKGSANLVKWMIPSGDSYLLVIGKKIEVYVASDNSCSSVIEQNSRVNQADFIGSEGNVMSVNEDKNLRIFNRDGEMISRIDFTTLGSRVRDFSVVKSSEGNPLEVVALATSNGKIILADLGKIHVHPGIKRDSSALHNDLDDNEDAFQVEDTPLSEVLISTFDISAEPRLTCVSAWLHEGVVSKKVRRRKSEKNKSSTEVIEDDNDDVIGDEEVEENDSDLKIDDNNSKKRKKEKQSPSAGSRESGGNKKVRFVAEKSMSSLKEKKEEVKGNTKKIKDKNNKKNKKKK